MAMMSEYVRVKHRYQILFLDFILSIWYNKSVNCRDFTISLVLHAEGKGRIFEEIFTASFTYPHAYFHDTANGDGGSKRSRDH